MHISPLVSSECRTRQRGGARPAGAGPPPRHQHPAGRQARHRAAGALHVNVLWSIGFKGSLILLAHLITCHEIGMSPAASQRWIRYSELRQTSEAESVQCQAVAGPAKVSARVHGCQQIRHLLLALRATSLGALGLARRLVPAALPPAPLGFLAACCARPCGLADSFSGPFVFIPIQGWAATFLPPAMSRCCMRSRAIWLPLCWPAGRGHARQ